jgi:hypothetical protein
MKRPVRVPSHLPESLHKRLSAYTLAASAAGVGLLALAQRTEARIVYTATKVNADNLSLDLNNDGTPDFVLNTFYTWGCNEECGSSWWFVYGYPRFKQKNAVVVDKNNYASALRRGVRIGAAHATSAAIEKVHWHSGSENKLLGDWASGSKGVTNRYLGLKFFIHGKAHYGWARLSLRIITKQSFGGRIRATLTGYAYETIPNKPIKAGETHGRDEATLGHLAAGASAIPAWRVKPTAATSH